VTDKSTIRLPTLPSPRTDFLVALFKMTPEQRANASPEKAAARYGIDEAYCRFYIGEARRTTDRFPMKTRSKTNARTRRR
jgi:hypothetical protein